MKWKGHNLFVTFQNITLSKLDKQAQSRKFRKLRRIGFYQIVQKIAKMIWSKWMTSWSSKHNAKKSVIQVNDSEVASTAQGRKDKKKIKPNAANKIELMQCLQNIY